MLDTDEPGMEAWPPSLFMSALGKHIKLGKRSAKRAKNLAGLLSCEAGEGQ